MLSMRFGRGVQDIEKEIQNNTFEKYFLLRTPFFYYYLGEEKIHLRVQNWS